MEFVDGDPIDRYCQSRDLSAGSSSVRFRRTAYVFVDTYSRTTLSDTSEIKGEFVFRFRRFGP